MTTSSYNNILSIEYPGIPSAGVYYFNTHSGLRYEVRFGRLQENILHSNIVFGVINDEFDGEEYIATNKGEVYQVMNTIVEIIKNYMLEHPKVNIYEFTDRNGIKQVIFTINSIAQDFGFNPLKLKFSKTTGSDIWYSNELIITDEFLEETTRFDYKSNGYFHGISYDILNIKQSIRLRCFFDRLDNETEVKDYYQITRGNTISTRALFKELSHYKFSTINPFVFRRVNILLIHDIIYIDTFRMTNKTNVKGSERLGYSNLSEAEFSVYINKSDIYISGLQPVLLPHYSGLHYSPIHYSTTI